MDHIKSARQPKVTIGIPVFNAARFLRKTINSALNQTFSDFELLIVDNASTDSSREIIESFNDSRIRFLKNTTNIGAEGNWNKILANAKGEFITLLPADDTIEPHSISERVKVLEHPNNHRIAFVFSSRTIINEQDKQILISRFFNEGFVSANKIRKLFVSKGMNVVGEPATVLFRAEAYQKIGGFDGTHPWIMDADYWLRLLDTGNAYAIKRPLCTFRITKTNISAQTQNKRLEYYLKLIDEIHLKYPSLFRKRSILYGKSRAWLNECLRKLFHLSINNKKTEIYKGKI